MHRLLGLGRVVGDETERIAHALAGLVQGAAESRHPGQRARDLPHSGELSHARPVDPQVLPASPLGGSRNRWPARGTSP